MKYLWTQWGISWDVRVAWLLWKNLEKNIHFLSQRTVHKAMSLNLWTSINLTSSATCMQYRICPKVILNSNLVKYHSSVTSISVIKSFMTSSNGNISALLALCEGLPPITGEFPSHRPVTRSFDVFFDLSLNKLLSKQSRRRWFETSSCSLWRHVMSIRNCA